MPAPIGETMELRVSQEEGYVLAATHGIFDVAATGPFRELLYPLIGQGGTNMVLDLSQSNSINSAGIGQLILLVTNANTHGSRVVLAACSPFVSEVLERCRLDRLTEIASTVPDAIRRIQG
jgi:anti-anti-sigma factor